MSKLKLGLVGCGRISEKHVDAIKQFPEQIEIIASCDQNLDRAKEILCEFPNTKQYQDLEEMLRNEALDILVITTPSGLHPEQSILAAKYKTNVVCEKPMATNFEDGRKMVEACESAGVQLFVVKQVRQTPSIKLLKKAIDQGRFGKIYLVNSNVFWTRPETYFKEAPWRGTLAMDGGVFFNQASHYVDLLSWLIGPVEKVQAIYATFARKIESEDSGVWNLKWENGAIGSLNVTMLTYPKNLEGSISILGEKGTVVLGGTGANIIKTWEFEDQLDNIESVNEQIANDNEMRGHTKYYLDVINTLRGKHSNEHVDGNSGLKSLELLVAAQLSAKNNCSINLPLKL